ncbi:ankyrin repeat-containing domain protein [Xylariales sp. AK1849]|nr:ankyrin repeat-containing domain protein [Xylariales sp. AK1849]
MPGLVPEDAAVFACARSGDILGLGYVFDEGLASVHDIGVSGYVSPFHLIILHLIEADLATQIQLSTEPIDGRDWQGRTAPSCTAARGDLEAITLLLQLAADPNAASLNGSTPLMFASRASTPSCITPLLAARARPAGLNSWQTGALGYPSRNSSDMDYMLPLLGGGADPNLRFAGERTPLTFTVSTGNFDHAACLLNFGARPEEQGGGLFGLVQIAIRNRYVQIALVLLEFLCQGLKSMEKLGLVETAQRLGVTGLIGPLEALLPDELFLNTGTEVDVFFDFHETL